MNARRTVGLVIVFALGLGCWARAAEPGNEKRTYWRHSDKKGGHYEKAEGDKWVEQSGPKKFFDFEEKARTDKYIEIYDPKRRVTLRLFDNRAEEKRKGKWYKLYDGMWGSPDGA